MAIARFEELEAWQRARALTREVYSVTSTGGFARDFGLHDQIRRAAVSAMSNIAEGFERYSRSEFRHFLSIAKGSAAEVRSQLQVARDLSYISERDFERLRTQCIELSRVIAALRSSLQRSQPRRPPPRSGAPST